MDEGSGLTEKQEKTLFQAQGPTNLNNFANSFGTLSRELGFESHGIGLNISKKIAQSLGGDLRYVKAPGSCIFEFKLLAKTIEANIFTSHEYKFLKVSFGFEKGADGSDEMLVPIVDPSSNEKRGQLNRIHPSYPGQTNHNKTSILIAEDSEICQKVLMSQIQSLGLMDQTAFFVSGDQVLDSAVKLIDESPDDPQPVKFMLLDNQMPRMTGQQVIAEFRRFISARNKERRVKLKEPVFVIVSAYLNAAFKTHLKQ